MFREWRRSIEFKLHSRCGFQKRCLIFYIVVQECGIGVSVDMVVLAAIERTHAEVGELSGRNWSLRVTLVFRKDKDQWVLVHRHADPLVAGISLEQAAALAVERQAA